MKMVEVIAAAIGNRFSLSALVVATAISTTAIATADTLAAIAAKAHLLGDWAQDCSQAPTSKNLHIAIEATADGDVRYITRWKPDAIDQKAKDFLGTSVLGIVIAAPTTISMRLLDDDADEPPSAHTYDVIVEINDDHLAVVESILASGQAVYKKGRVVTTGKPVPVFERCRARPAS